MKTLLLTTTLVIATSYLAPAVEAFANTADMVSERNTMIENILVKRG